MAEIKRHEALMAVINASLNRVFNKAIIGILNEYISKSYLVMNEDRDFIG